MAMVSPQWQTHIVFGRVDCNFGKD